MWLNRQKNSKEGQKNSLKSGVFNVQEVCETSEIHTENRVKTESLLLNQYTEKKFNLRKIHEWTHISYLLLKCCSTNQLPKGFILSMTKFPVAQTRSDHPRIKDRQSRLSVRLFLSPRSIYKINATKLSTWYLKYQTRHQELRPTLAGIWKADQTQAVCLANI